MEPEGSLSHSQVPSTCPYPEPARFSPYPTSHFLKIHLNIIPPSTPRSPKWFFLSGFPTKTLNTPLLHNCRSINLGKIKHPFHITDTSISALFTFVRKTIIDCRI